MKIAVCYSGFLRSIRDTYPHIISQLSLESHDVDYFIHTWDTSQYSDEIEYTKEYIKPKLMMCETPKEFQRHPYNFINPDQSFSDYCDEFEKAGEDDKKIFEPPSQDNNYHFHKDLEVTRFKYYSSFPYNFLSEFYSFYKTLDLKKIYEQQQDFKYDCVVRIRSDHIFHYNIDIESFDMNKMNVLNCAYHRDTDLTINNHFACASTKLMDIYGECFLFIPVYYFTYKVDFIQELYIGKHLRVNNIPINKFNVPYTLIRK